LSEAKSRPVGTIPNPHSNGFPSSTIHHPSSSDFQAALTRLSLLTPADYDRVRRSEASRLGIRLETLDAEVARCRAQLSNGANGTALILPPIEPWPEAVNGCELLHEIKARFILRLALPPGGPAALTLWSAHAHAFQAFRLCPRLNLTSPKHGSGKTTTLDIIACLVPRPLRTENLTAPVLFRLVDQFQPTLLLDEVDSYIFQSEELRGLLNAGHKPTARAVRCRGENNGVRAYKAFAPAALAGIGSLPGTLLDRSVSIPLIPAKPGEITEHFDPHKTEIETILARKLARWAQDNFTALKTCDPVLPPAAYNRLGDNWRPLFAIAQIAGGDWPALAIEAFTTLTKDQTPTPDETALALLADIRTVFTQSAAPQMFSRTLTKSLQALPDSPWQGTDGHKRLTEIRLARHLRTFGIFSHVLRIGNARANGYTLADFSAAFAAHLDNDSAEPSNS
jgi:putative DNA primase/helicase